MLISKKVIFVIMISIISFITVTMQLSEDTVTTFYMYGSQDDTVKTIQDKLKRWGYYEGSVDGIFGYKTSEALKEFQKKYNLETTGIADVETLELLGIYKTEYEIKHNSVLSNETDLFLLAKAIEIYAKGEPYVGKVGFASVILNRVESPYFPNTVHDVIYQDNLDLKLNYKPSETSIKAAKDALWGFDPSNGALYRWQNKNIKNNNMIGKPITIVIGNYNFGLY